MPLSKAMATALAAVARMKGDSDMSAAELLQMLAVALGKQPRDDDDADDREERRLRAEPSCTEPRPSGFPPSRASVPVADERW